MQNVKRKWKKKIRPRSDFLVCGNYIHFYTSIIEPSYYLRVYFGSVLESIGISVFESIKIDIIRFCSHSNSKCRISKSTSSTIISPSGYPIPVVDSIGSFYQSINTCHFYSKSCSYGFHGYRHSSCSEHLRISWKYPNIINITRYIPLNSINIECSLNKTGITSEI